MTVAQLRQPTIADQLRAKVRQSALPPEEQDTWITLIGQLPEEPSKPQPIAWQAQPEDRAKSDPVIAAAIAHLQP